MRSLILILLTVGGFFAVFLFVVSSFSAVRKKIRYGRERLNRYLTVIAVSRRLRTQLGQVKTKKRKRRIPFSNLFEALVTRRETSKRLESDLLQANIPLKPGEFLALQLIGIHILKNIAAGSGIVGFKNIVIVIMNGQNNDFNSVVFLL
jgi:hypothetical protein